jgi:hypothetical protein
MDAATTNACTQGCPEAVALGRPKLPQRRYDLFCHAKIDGSIAQKLATIVPTSSDALNEVRRNNAAEPARHRSGQILLRRHEILFWLASTR